MKPWLRTVLISVFAVIFLVSAGMLIGYFAESMKQQDSFDALANIVQQARPTQPPVSDDTTAPGETKDVSTPTEPVSPWVEVTDPETGEIVSILPDYAEIYKINNDVAGWLVIEDTKINYPVMHYPSYPDYYLYRNFYKDYSGHGSLYAREECDINTPSDNITIYGHHMKDGSMFSALTKYSDKSFYDTHRYITFDTLTEHHTYQVFAVFITTATVGHGFAYHDFINGSEEEFNQFVKTCKRLSLYDTDITPVYGDKMITLSTCEYTQVNGRFVVVAVRID